MMSAKNKKSQGLFLDFFACLYSFFLSFYLNIDNFTNAYAMFWHSPFFRFLLFMTIFFPGFIILHNFLSIKDYTSLLKTQQIVILKVK